MTVDEILARLTFAEKVALLTGADYWHTKAFPDAGVDAIMLTDGPHGLRKQADAADPVSYTHLTLPTNREV